MARVRALYFTDVLCVWAYVNQVRIDRLCQEMDEELVVESRCCAVFGDVQGKLAERWADRGGAAGYAAHVRTVVADFEHAQLHDDTWQKVTPTSSMPAHLWLCAVRRLEDTSEVQPGAHYAACWSLRRAFFQDARDISDSSVLRELAEAEGLPVAPIEALLASGQAHAALSQDLEQVRRFDVKLSPTFVLNEGRQRLNGNVGYRVIEANVRELMQERHPNEASWC